ncbi:MAG TPA: 4-alpha-glucanotransferase [Longimicrobiaceae bacterium]|nr:4-alpha-glucanotransferase [Longimicrobiaceae bacterium]
MSERVPARRRAGILLHPTSLPGPGVGDLGPEAYRFADWLAEAGQSLWQVLPLVATGEGGSPYNALSAFAGNPLLLSPRGLVDDGLLEEDETEAPAGLPDEGVDFQEVGRWKDRLLRRAHGAFRAGWAPGLRRAFAAYRRRQKGWLEDWALFRALRDEFGAAGWTEWSQGLAHRDPEAMGEAASHLREEVERHAFGQFLFDRQWGTLRAYAAERGVRLVGDVPIFVAHDSADVWAHQELFELDRQGRPTAVSGVPPDYFSATGQRWGNPLYRWDVVERSGWRWWIERLRRTLELVDVARIDHFRGFEAYWEIPADEPTAIGGRWVPGPGAKLFAALQRELGPLPLIAEDLGIIAPQVDALREELGLPGMRVLQFAFGTPDPANPHLPANHPAASVAYTGTHDNDTAAGWFRALPPGERAAVRRLTGAEDGEMHWGMIEAVLRSPADTAIVPLQDVLGVGSEARMNTPGTTAGNWEWRLRAGELTPALAARLRGITRASGRLHGDD